MAFNRDNRKVFEISKEYAVLSIDKETGEIVQNSYNTVEFSKFIKHEKHDIETIGINDRNNNPYNSEVMDMTIPRCPGNSLTEQDKKEFENEMMMKRAKKNTCRTIDFRSVESVQVINQRFNDCELTQVDRFTLEKLAGRVALKMCFDDTTNSFMYINKRKIYHYRIDNPKVVSAAIRLMPGFSIELGTQLYRLKEALKMCKLPIGIVEAARFNDTAFCHVQLQDFTSETATKVNIVTLTVDTNTDIIKEIEINDVASDIIGTYRLLGVFRVAVSKVPKERTRKLQIENAMRAITTEKVELLKIVDKPNIIEFTYKTGGSKLTYQGSFVAIGNEMFRLKNICIIQ